MKTNTFYNPKNQYNELLASVPYVDGKEAALDTKIEEVVSDREAAEKEIYHTIETLNTIKVKWINAGRGDNKFSNINDYFLSVLDPTSPLFMPIDELKVELGQTVYIIEGTDNPDESYEEWICQYPNMEITASDGTPKMVRLGAVDSILAREDSTGSVSLVHNLYDTEDWSQYFATDYEGNLTHKPIKGKAVAPCAMKAFVDADKELRSSQTSLENRVLNIETELGGSTVESEIGRQDSRLDKIEAVIGINGCCDPDGCDTSSGSCCEGDCNIFCKLNSINARLDDNSANDVEQEKAIGELTDGLQSLKDNLEILERSTLPDQIKKALDDAKDYTDSQVGEVLADAKEYTDDEVAKAKAYTDREVEKAADATLASAKVYTDGKLSEAKEYADNAYNLLNTRVDNIETKVDTIDSNLGREIFEVDKKIDTLSDKVGENTSSINAHTVSIANIKTDVAANNASITKLNSDFSTAIAELKEADTNVLEQAKAYTDLLDSKVDALDENLNNSITALESTTDALNTTLNGVNGRVNTLESTANTLSAKVDNIDTKVDTQVNNVETLISTVNNTLEGKIFEVDKKVDIATTSLKDSITALETTTSGLNTALETAKRDFNTALEGVNARIDTLESTTNTLSTDVTNINTRVSTVNDTLDGKIDGLGTRVDAIESNLTTRITTSENDIQGLKSADVNTLSNAKAYADSIKNALNCEIDTVESGLQNSISNLEASINNTNTRLQDMKDNHNALSEQVDDLAFTVSSFGGVFLRGSINVFATATLTNGQITFSTEKILKKISDGDESNWSIIVTSVQEYTEADNTAKYSLIYPEVDYAQDKITISFDESKDTKVFITFACVNKVTNDIITLE